MNHFIRFHSLFALPVIFFFLSGPPARASEQWKALFDGRSLEGWVVRGGTAKFRVDGKDIVGTTVETKNPAIQTFLCTVQNYADFDLELDVLCDPELNSGIQIRSHVYDRSTPTKRRVREKGEVYGYQCEITTREKCMSGNFWDEGRLTIWYDDLIKKPEACAAFKESQWNHYRIVAQGDHIRSWVNGVACADFYDTKDASGFIGLQVHSVQSGTGPFAVRFKNIKLRRLKTDEPIR